jgi:hypothetical protein
MSKVYSDRQAARRFALSAWGAALVVAGAIVGCLVLFEDKGFLARAIQSDSLLPAQAVWDYATHDYAVSGFQLPRAPSIVPDLLVYAVVHLASESWRLATLAYGVLSLLALAAIGGAIVRDVTGCTWRTGAQSALLLTLVCIMLALPITPASKHLLLFMPAHHGGSFILSLATLGIARSWLGRPEVARLALLLGLVVAGVLSDLLFVIAAVIPLLAAIAYLAALHRISTGKVAVMLVCLVAGTAAALLLDLALVREPLSAVDWARVPGRAYRFAESIREIAVAAPVTAFMIGGLPLIAFLAYPGIVRRSGLGEAGGFWWVASASGMLGTILVLPLLYIDSMGYRYASALLWWPLIWAAAGLVRSAGPVRGYAFATALAGVTVVLGFAYVRAGPHAPALLSLHRRLEMCLTESASSAGLKAGLASYWHARVIAASSDWRLQVDQIGRDGSAQYWGNDKFWYTHDIHDGARPPDYNYIVMAGLDETAIRVHYGSPDRTLECGAVSVWVFDDPAAVRQALVGLSPILSADLAGR